MMNQMSAALLVVCGIGAALMAPMVQAQTTWYVDDDATLGGDGLTWNSAYTYLQDALWDASPNDEIRVAGGTYKPDQDEGGHVTPGNTTETFQLITGVEVYGGYAGPAYPGNPDDRDIESYKTILSGDLSGNDGPGSFDNNGENSLHVVTGSGTDNTAVLDGFTIAAGNGGDIGTNGGGMYNNVGSPTVANCTFTRNLANGGGGMYNGGTSSPSVANCTFGGNKAWFWEIMSGSGGGMYNGANSSPTLDNCVFSGNSATGMSGGGGGMSNGTNSNPTLVNCVFSGNTTTESGGAVSNGGSTSTLVNCLFAGNRASGAGGGMSMTNNCALTLTNCTFVNNSSGLACSGMLSPSDVHLANCILWGDGTEISNSDGSTITVTYSDVENSWPGEGNIDADPRFPFGLAGNWTANGTYDVNTSQTTFWDINANWSENSLVGKFLNPDSTQTLEFVIVANTAATISVWGDFAALGAPGMTYYIYDYHLSRMGGDSPCIDAADNDADTDAHTPDVQPLPDTDLDLRPRFCDEPGIADTGNGTPPIVDMGAYEYVTPTPQSTLFVDAGATGGFNNGTSWDDAYTELRLALEAAAEFPDVVDEIWVAAETYTPHRDDRGATFQLLDNLGVYGGFAGWETIRDQRNWDTNETVLSGDLDGDDQPEFVNYGENSCHVVTGSGTDATAVLDGFTISGGNANWAIHTYYGGGIYNDSGSPSLANCNFSENYAQVRGGGMFNDTGSPSLANCDFSGNAADDGGGIYSYSGSPSLTDCDFSGNSADHGGGMYNSASSPSLADCDFSGNTADHDGGGMYNGGSSPSLADCDFSGNSAENGGGMHNSGNSSPELVNCTFTANVADYIGPWPAGGGGMYSYWLCHPTLVNCTFSGNQATNDAHGGGIYAEYASGGTLTNCTFSGNTTDNNGGGIYNFDNSPQTLTNCILWDNAPDQLVDRGPASTVTYSDIEGGWPGDCNIGDDPVEHDPQFVDPGDDLHLERGSPCIDAGNNDADLPETDLDGDPRFVNDPDTPDCPHCPDPADCGDPPIVDMGAYELQLRNYWWDARPYPEPLENREAQPMPLP